MSEQDYNSPMYRKKLAEQAASKPKLREYTVGSPEDEFDGMQSIDDLYNNPPPTQQSQNITAQELEQIRQQRKAKFAGTDKVSEMSRRRIELLTGIGRLTSDVDIDGTIFSIRTLKTKEAKDATMAALSVLTSAEASFEIKRQFLARSIFQIDGNDVDDVLGVSDLESKLSVIDELGELVVDKLYREFEVLRNELKNKYGLNTEAQVKEVSEDLKK